jgi:hypothetical protein
VEQLFVGREKPVRDQSQCFFDKNLGVWRRPVRRWSDEAENSDGAAKMKICQHVRCEPGQRPIQDQIRDTLRKWAVAKLSVAPGATIITGGKLRQKTVDALLEAGEIQDSIGKAEPIPPKSDEQRELVARLAAGCHIAPPLTAQSYNEAVARLARRPMHGGFSMGYEVKPPLLAPSDDRLGVVAMETTQQQYVISDGEIIPISDRLTFADVPRKP